MDDENYVPDSDASPEDFSPPDDMISGDQPDSKEELSKKDNVYKTLRLPQEPSENKDAYVTLPLDKPSPESPPQIPPYQPAQYPLASEDQPNAHTTLRLPPEKGLADSSSTTPEQFSTASLGETPGENESENASVSFSPTRIIDEELLASQGEPASPTSSPSQEEPSPAQPAGEPPRPQEPPPPAPPLSQALSTADERTWAMLAHLSVLANLVTGFLGPVIALVIYLVYKDRSRFVAFHSMQAFLFQIVAWVGGGALAAIAWAISGALAVVLIGCCLMPFALAISALPLAALIYGAIAALKVNQGEDFRYWLVADWTEDLLR